MMPRGDKKIYIAGHRGLVGSAVVRALQQAGFDNLLTADHASLELTDARQVDAFFRQHRPDRVVLAAAKVGGIAANQRYAYDFIQQNLMIQSQIIDAARRYKVERLLFLGSSCIYPRDCPQPIKESYLLSGALESTNRAYALAKIAGIELCAAANRQYGMQCLALMPCNLYGPGDNFDVENAHVLPALLQKMHHAKVTAAASVSIWGSGSPKREFLHSDDLAQACLLLLQLPEDAFIEQLHVADFPIINVGSSVDISIAQLAQQVRAVVGFQGKLGYDQTKPDGTPRKLLDSRRIQALGWQARIDLSAGLAEVYQHYVKQRYSAE